MTDWHRQLRPQDRVRLQSGAIATIHGKHSDGIILGMVSEANKRFRSLRWNRDGQADPAGFDTKDDIAEKEKVK